jgi:hypothetical protein
MRVLLQIFTAGRDAHVMVGMQFWFHTFLERRIKVLTSRIEVRGFLFLDVRSDSPNIPNALFLFVS